MKMYLSIIKAKPHACTILCYKPNLNIKHLLLITESFLVIPKFDHPFKLQVFARLSIQLLWLFFYLLFCSIIIFITLLFPQSSISAYSTFLPSPTHKKGEGGKVGSPDSSYSNASFYSSTSYNSGSRSVGKDFLL